MSFTDRPSQIVETPFGPMRATFNSGTHISLRDLSDRVWNDETKAYQEGPSITINRVAYRATFSYELVNGEWKQTYGSIDRVGSVKAFDYSSAALNKVSRTLLQVVTELPANAPDLLQKAQIVSLTDAHAHAVRKVEKARTELNEAEAEERKLREELTQAQADAGQIDGEHMEKRYLTRGEIKQLAERVSTVEFARHLTEYDHQPGNGVCLEVVLSVAQAREIDTLCEDLRIGR